MKTIPVDIVFHPNWWNKNYGIVFDKDFFYDPNQRVKQEQKMRSVLYERFGDLKLGEKDPKPRPVIGGVNLAAGFIVSEILGCEVEYCEDASPEVKTAYINDKDISTIKKIKLFETPVMKDLIKLMDTLEADYGYLEGDINFGGVQNIALDLRGEELFIDYYQNPKLVTELLENVSKIILDFVSYIKTRTNTSSISVNRVIKSINSDITMTSNCTTTMVSKEIYDKFLFKHDDSLGKVLPPFAIHHCGNDMEKVASSYNRVSNTVLFDVGWGSDVASCRRAIPDKILSLRLDPVKMKSCTENEVEKDLAFIIDEARPLDKVAVSCINIDYGTPDENIRKIFEVLGEYEKEINCKS